MDIFIFKIYIYFFITVWISLYYVAFYVIMVGLFALSIYSLMKTMNPYTPDYQDRLKSPGIFYISSHFVIKSI